MQARSIVRLGAIVISEAAMRHPDAETIAVALLQYIRTKGLDVLPWSKASRTLRQRMQFVRYHDDSWPDVSDDALMHALDDWLLPYVSGIRRRSELERLDLHAALSAMLSWQQRRELEERAPTHLQVPSGSNIPIDYSSPAAPVLAVRLQEMFGAVDTPRIERGKVPLTIHLLSPAGRPAQVTRDLASFWRTTYFDVRKDLKGRYPKHYWPDDPLVAEPTRRARPR